VTTGNCLVDIPHVRFFFFFFVYLCAVTMVVLDRYYIQPHTEVSEDGPLINGLRDQYELNEQLNVNCTSPSITPSIGSHQIKLSWQLNHQTVISTHFNLLLLSSFQSCCRD
jgi:hypothetical protein